MSITIHNCEFPKSVKHQNEVWKVYYYVKEKLGGKNAPKIQELIKILCENWDKYLLEYNTQNGSRILTSNKDEVDSLTTRYNHVERDTIAIAKLKRYIYKILEDPTIDRKGLKKLLEQYRISED
jgi:cupin superfamily acireductone dioxygenase involved in methionine salvage